MSVRDIALTGVPRGGTTLACHLLHACTDTVALFEPMDVTALDTRPGQALDQIEAFYAETRRGLQASGTAPSMHRDGAVPDNPFGERDWLGRRQSLVDHGQIHLGRPTDGFNLVVKHNAAFSALLPGLATRFDTFAIVRNPLAVLASWNTVDLPVGQGRLPAGERLDAGLRQQLERTPGLLERQLIVLRWFFERFLLHLPAARVLRYEDIVTSGGDALRHATQLEGARRADLGLRNASALYRQNRTAPFAEAILQTADTPWARWYSPTAIAELATALEVPAG